MEVSRRIELQDICSTSRLQLTLNMGVDADIYATFLKYSLGDEQHGTKETIDYWMNRGFLHDDAAGLQHVGSPFGGCGLTGVWAHLCHPMRRKESNERH